MSGYKLQAELLTGELAAEEEGRVVGPHAVGAVVGLLHHLAALAPEVAAGHHLDSAEMLLNAKKLEMLIGVKSHSREHPF